MFNIGGGEIIVILLIALLVLGPERLPDATRKVGRALHEFRRLTSGFQEEVRNAMDLGDGPASAGSPSPRSTEDALDRASPGPRLVGPSLIGSPADTTPPAGSGSSTTPETFVADVTPHRADGDGDDPTTD